MTDLKSSLSTLFSSIITDKELQGKVIAHVSYRFILLTPTAKNVDKVYEEYSSKIKKKDGSVSNLVN